MSTETISSDSSGYPPEVRRFDGAWYLRAYPECGIRTANVPTPRQLKAAERHYRKRGAPQGKNPNRYFSETWYLKKYPDVAAAVERGDFKSGFDHYVRSGADEGFEASPVTVDPDWYFDTYPEVLTEIRTPSPQAALTHYLCHGARRGMSPHVAFAEAWYLERNPDVRQEVERGRFLCGYQHFLEYGFAEQRQPHPLFGESHYRFLNPDVDDAVLQGVYPSGYFHLVHHGLAESRPWRMERVDFRDAATQLHLCRLEEFLRHDRRLDFRPFAGSAPEVSILLILWNRAELTLACLESLLRLQDVTFEVVIVDNLSTDRTRDLLDRLDGARIFLNDENAGYTRAANQAAAAAEGRLLLNLNNDAELLPFSLRAAVDRLDSTPQAGVVGGRIVTLDGRLQEAGSVVWNHGGTDGYGRGDDPMSGAYLFPREVDYCSGVFFLTPRELFERFGGYDLLFTPAYYEESDFCFRIREHGFKTLYEPDCLVIHFETASLAASTGRTELLRKNRRHFVERHGKQLESAYPPDVANFFPASQRASYRGRILMLDDYVPFERLGGGSPRAREILLALHELGFFVTFFATNPETLDRGDLAGEYPEEGLEFIDHLGRGGFLPWWQPRRGHYDAVIVSRAHNFRELLASGFEPQAETARVIFDAEALVSGRQELRRKVLGDQAVAESDLTRTAEQNLARRADEIWAVSKAEGEQLAGPGGAFQVVAHGLKAEPGDTPWSQRDHVLFVGRLDEEWNPNVDALRWYLSEIHPRVRRALHRPNGEAPRLRVVGERGDYELPDADGVDYLGRVDDLAPVFDRHRVFIAPTRFAAGIPHKVANAALHGLPVVATSLLAGQLGWRHDTELADGGDNDPERFAAQVGRVYCDESAWHTLRSAALRRAREDHGPEALRTALGRALEQFPDPR